MSHDVAHEEGTTRAERMSTTWLVFACVISLVSITIVLFFIVFGLYWVGFWKLALALPFVAAAGAGIWWWQSSGRRSPPAVLTTGLIAVAVGMTLVFSSVWRSERAHDAHLAGMVHQLCSYQPPDASLVGCTGSITNTGNGNSCRYWARATIHEATTFDSLIAYLQEHGFVETSLDIWDQPMDDGLTYWRPSDTSVEVSLMESYRPPDDDLRCT